MTEADEDEDEDEGDEDDWLGEQMPPPIWHEMLGET